MEPPEMRRSDRQQSALPPVFPGGPSARLTLEAISPLFPLLERNSAGAILVDEASRLTWINDSYCRLLGIDDPASAIGRPVGEVIPHTRMPEVVRSGRPILLDIMEYGAHQLVVTRLPLHNRETGAITGAVAFTVFADLESLTPLMGKYRRLQHDLAVARRALASRGARYALGDFIGASPGVLEIKRRARLAAARSTPVLLLGETGTGKEVLAQAIHADSPRFERPFVAVNVAAVPENLLEAEFFGVAPGAYTGADRRARQEQGDCLLYMGSVHSKLASPLKAPYVAAKHALLGLCRTVAKEGAAHRVRSNVICPGFVRTPLVDRQIPEQAQALGISEEAVVRDVMLKDTVDQEFTTLEDIAEVALHLAAFPTAALTGQSVVASHGWYMQ